MHMSTGRMENRVFLIEMITTAGEIGSLPTGIYEGSLTLDNSNHRNMVPLPLQAAGNSTLTLMLGDDARLIHISGKNVFIEPEGEFRFVEHVDFTHLYPDE
jgi:hypothetical protein